MPTSFSGPNLHIHTPQLPGLYGNYLFARPPSLSDSTFLEGMSYRVCSNIPSASRGRQQPYQSLRKSAAQVQYSLPGNHGYLYSTRRLDRYSDM